MGGLGHHYGGDGGCGYQNISMTIIEQVQVKTPDCLAERELYWQHQLRAYLENGGNAHCRKKEFKWKKTAQPQLVWKQYLLM